MSGTELPAREVDRDHHNRVAPDAAQTFCVANARFVVLRRAGERGQGQFHFRNAIDYATMQALRNCNA